MLSVIDTMFQPREITFSGTALTIDDSYRGAIIRFTSASAVTVTLPSTLTPGFMFSFVPYGAGAISFSGTTLGERVPLVNYAGFLLLMSTGEWLIIGGA